MLTFLIAFLGGALALLSPCSAMLLPAFFSATAGHRARLGAQLAVFYLGLVTVLAPLGMGASALGAFFLTHRSTLIWVAGALLVVFGAMQIFGLGFDLQRAMPDRVSQAHVAKTGLLKAYLMGLVSGVAGFCAGPILGGILTLAATSGNFVTGPLMMSAYALGMVAPLTLLAVTWDRAGVRNVLRGREFAIGGKRFHSTSVLTGLLLITVGVLFVLTNGLVSVPEFVSLESQAAFQAKLQEMGPVTAAALVAGIAAVAVLVWRWWPSRRGRASQNLDEEDRAVNSD